MSMHQIEDMIEESVHVLFNSGEKAVGGFDVRDICYNLYMTQDVFDCGATEMRVRDELVAMGYFAEVGIDRLSAEDRAALKDIDDSVELLPSGAYAETEFGVALIPYGLPVWDEMVDSGAISLPRMGDIPEIGCLELAEIVISLAAKQAESDDGHVRDHALLALAYWYVFVPLMMLLYDGDYEELDRERVFALRDLASVPEAFAIIAPLGLYNEIMDTSEADPPFDEWSQPYIEWVEENVGEMPESEDSEDELIDLITESVDIGDFVRAGELTMQMSEPLRAMFSITVSMSFHMAEHVKEEKSPLPPGLMPLDEVERTIMTYIEADTTGAVAAQLNVSLSQCRFFMGDIEGGKKCLDDGFDVAVEKLQPLLEEEREPLIMQLTAAYYGCLVSDLDNATRRSLDMPDWLADPREAADLIISVTDIDDCTDEECCTIATLLIVAEDFDGAEVWVDKAEEIGDNNIAPMIAALRKRIGER